jgi:hypothetical protein
MIASLRSERLKRYVHQRDDQKDQSRLEPGLHRRTRPRTGKAQNKNRNSLDRGPEPSGSSQRSGATAQSAGQTPTIHKLKRRISRRRADGH